MLEQILKQLFGDNVVVSEITLGSDDKGRCLRCSAKTEHYFCLVCEETVAADVLAGRCWYCGFGVERGQCHCRRCARPLSNHPRCEQEGQGDQPQTA